mmetsp:Transcript_48437/g.89857  ORF Transcript_48437/g.89857 Transcript_48437/m.89857 type:complete len:496 (-) Transcript_48437:425-1912(-)
MHYGRVARRVHWPNSQRRKVTKELKTKTQIYTRREPKSRICNPAVNTQPTYYKDHINILSLLMTELHHPLLEDAQPRPALGPPRTPLGRRVLVVRFVHGVVLLLNGAGRVLELALGPAEQRRNGELSVFACAAAEVGCGGVHGLHQGRRSGGAAVAGRRDQGGRRSGIPEEGRLVRGRRRRLSVGRLMIAMVGQKMMIRTRRTRGCRERKVGLAAEGHREGTRADGRADAASASAVAVGGDDARPLDAADAGAGRLVHLGGRDGRRGEHLGDGDGQSWRLGGDDDGSARGGARKRRQSDGVSRRQLLPLLGRPLPQRLTRLLPRLAVADLDPKAGVGRVLLEEPSGRVELPYRVDDVARHAGLVPLRGSEVVLLSTADEAAEEDVAGVVVRQAASAAKDVVVRELEGRGRGAEARRRGGGVAFRVLLRRRGGGELVHLGGRGVAVVAARGVLSGAGQGQGIKRRRWDRRRRNDDRIVLGTIRFWGEKNCRGRTFA